MKKRLLITSALMTAVLGASLATGTYAWYQASANMSLESDITTSLSTQKVSSLADATLDVKLVWTNETENVVLTDDKGQEKAYVSGQLVDMNSGSNNKYYTVTVDCDAWADGNAYTQAQKNAAAGTYTATVATSNARFILHDEAPAAGVAGWYTADTITFTITVSNQGVVSSEGVTFYVSVKGDNGQQTAETEAISSVLSVTIEKAA